MGDSGASESTGLRISHSVDNDNTSDKLGNGDLSGFVFAPPVSDSLPPHPNNSGINILDNSSDHVDMDLKNAFENPNKDDSSDKIEAARRSAKHELQSKIAE